MEATIDFADEDVPVDVYPEVTELLGRVSAEMQREAEGVKIAERIRDGFEVAIVGAPNVGKSTLLNRLAGREAAITSEYAGTTRDVIEVRMDLGGLPVTLLDTAGLRDTEDFVEGIGIERARQRAAAADLRIYMLLPNDEPDLDLEEDDIVVAAKSDTFPQERLGISSRTGEGIDSLVALIQERLEARTQSVGIAMRERHREALLRSLLYLQAAGAQIEAGADMPDLVAEELRSSIRAVDMLVGRVDVEDLLDEIFSSFCIGK